MSAPTHVERTHPRWNLLIGLLFLGCFPLGTAFGGQTISAPPPQDATFQARLIRTPSPNSGEKISHPIAGLELDVPWEQVQTTSAPSKVTTQQAELPVKETLGKDGRPFRWVVLRGVFKPSPTETTLVCTYSYDRNHLSPQIKLDRENRFAIPVPIQGDRIFFELTAVDLHGLIAREDFKIDCPGCLSPIKKSLAAPIRHWGFTPAIGITQLSYSETRLSGPISYSAILLTPKLGVTYAITDQWSLGVSAFYNAVSLSSSDPSVGMRFLGLNARAGYSLPSGPSSWKTTLMLGAYSLGMSVSSKALGFDRLFGPQVVLAERKSFDFKNALSAYVKYSALVAGSEISLSQRELAGGLSYERRLGSRSYTASFDASQFDFSIGAVQIESRTLTFSLGMNL